MVFLSRQSDTLLRVIKAKEEGESSAGKEKFCSLKKKKKSIIVISFWTCVNTLLFELPNLKSLKMKCSGKMIECSYLLKMSMSTPVYGAWPIRHGCRDECL